MADLRMHKLKNLNVTDQEMLSTDAWEDDDGKFFSREVGTEKFTLEVIAEAGKMTVIMDESETLIYDGIHMEKWGVFENYFKTGNYLQTRDEGSFATVKYYDLTISHD